VNVIDFHAHAFAGAVAKKAMTLLIGESGYTAFHDGTLVGLRQATLRAGVSQAVVLSIATKPKQVAVINDWVIARGGPDLPNAPHASDRSDSTLVFFGALHPAYPEFQTEIQRLRDAGIRGIKFHPNYQDFFPDDPALLPMFRAIARAGLIVLIHGGHDIAFPDAPGSPDRLARLADTVPDLLLVCAHFGAWRQWDLVDRHLIGRPNVYLDTSFTLGDLPDDRFLDLARRHGTDRVLFATDSPWRDQQADLAHLARLPFTEAEREAILGGNAERLLRGATQ
jgi:predicted TIM-barrel fold metal-dependent hydrolase